MLLSAVSVLVVAQSSSEIPEGLMNNPVQYGCNRFTIALVVLVINIQAAEVVSWTVKYPPVCLEHSSLVFKASLLVCF